MKLMIIDTVGGNRFTDKYKALFPGVKLRGIEKRNDGPCNSHGYQVGYLAGCLLSLIGGDHEIVFVRNFDGEGRPVPGSDEWILDVIADERPNGINNSWGQWDGDDRIMELYAQMAWKDWAPRYVKLLKDLNIASFSAAGNSDSSRPGRPDLDSDLDYPWKLIPFIANVIGSHQQDGTPSEFSGDGNGVQCCFWADPVFAPNGDGVFTLTQGTSFASPKALAVWSYFVRQPHLWREFVKNNCTRPENWAGQLPHPKWGEGSLEHKFQEVYRQLPIFALPNHFNINPSVKYFEFKKQSI